MFSLYPYDWVLSPPLSNQGRGKGGGGGGGRVLLLGGLDTESDTLRLRTWWGGMTRQSTTSLDEAQIGARGGEGGGETVTARRLHPEFTTTLRLRTE